MRNNAYNMVVADEITVTTLQFLIDHPVVHLAKICGTIGRNLDAHTTLV